MNRVAHSQVVALLEGDEGGAITAQDDQITLNLAPVIEEVKQRLVDQGFALAERIPDHRQDVRPRRVRRHRPGPAVLHRAQRDGRLAALRRGGTLRRRRAARPRPAQGPAQGCAGCHRRDGGALGVGLTLVRTLLRRDHPGRHPDRGERGNVFDTLVRFLRTGLRATAVLFLLLALAAFLTGPSAAAVGPAPSSTEDSVRPRSGADAAGWHLDPVGNWIHAHQGGLRLATFIAGGLTLMFWSQPTAWVVVIVALLVVLALVVIRFLAQPPAPGTAPPTEETTAATQGHPSGVRQAGR